MRVQLYYANWHELTRIPDDQGTFIAVVQRGEQLLDEEFYDCVYRCELNCETPIDVCNKLFEQFNFGDRGGCKVRSMSVGDLVIIDYALWKEVFVCKPTGWQKVDLEDQVNVDLIGSLMGWSEENE